MRIVASAAKPHHCPLWIKATASLIRRRNVLTVPAVDVRRAGKHGGQVVGGALIQGHLTVGLMLGLTQSVEPEVRGVPAHVVAHLVIDDRGIVSRRMKVGPARPLDKRGAAAEMYFTGTVDEAAL